MATRVWRANTSGSWDDSSFWSGGVVPVAGDTAIVPSGDAIVDGLRIEGESIVLGGSASATSVTLTVYDASFVATSSTISGVVRTSLTISGGTHGPGLDADIVVSGATVYAGLMFDGAPNGSLTIDVTSGASFTLDNSGGHTAVVVYQESTLVLSGGEVVNGGILQIEGGLHIASGASLSYSSDAASITSSAGSSFIAPGQAAVLLEHGGNVVVDGSVGSGEYVDFIDSTGRVILSSGASFSGAFGFGPNAGGNTIDVQGIETTSLTVSGGMLHLMSSGADLAAFDIRALDPNFAPIGTPSRSDFLSAPDGHGGTLITYSPDQPQVLHQSLAMPVYATAGTMIPLSSLFEQSFGTANPNFASLTLLTTFPFSNTTTNSGYWYDPNTTPQWYISSGGTLSAVSSGTVVSNLAEVFLDVGNQIDGPAQFSVQATSGATLRTSENIVYDIWSVDPAVSAGVANWGYTGVPVSGAIEASAWTFNALYQGIANTNLCNWIADNVGAGAGAPMPPNDASIDPTQNQPGGFWRIAYTGTSDNPIVDWSTLVQPGDIVRMGWFHPESGIASGHTTTVLGYVTSDGQMLFYDNIDDNGPYESIGVHYNDYYDRTDPADITIYRLDPNGQYLILGSDLGEQLQGTVYNDLIQPGGGADVITTGPGNDEIQGTAAQLSSITVTDFALGDYLDITDLAPGATVAAFLGGTLDVFTGSTGLVDTITVPTPPSGQAFVTESDGKSGTFVELLAASNGTIGLSAGQTMYSYFMDPGVAVAVSSGAFASSIAVSSGNSLAVLSGGFGERNRVSSGGVERVLAGGVADSATVFGGGLIVVSAGGQTNQDFLLSGGQEIVSAGGLANGIDLSSGGIARALKGGVLSGTIAESGGVEVVSSAGNARATIVSFGGSEIISNGGTASGTTLLSGAAQTVSSGGLANGAVLAGGSQTVASRGTATATTVAGGGTETVFGTTISTMVGSGGTAIVSNGGTASTSLILSGGLEQVMSGGAISSAVLSGGTLDIASGGLVLSSTITFSGGGSLVLEDTKFKGRIAGLNASDPDSIDLTALAFHAGSMTVGYVGNLQGGGTLTIGNGMETVKLALIGSYVVGNFQVTDNGGFTRITDPVASSGGTPIAPPH